MTLHANPLTGKRILLVEDERAVREALRILLSMDAHTIVEANNGAEAFALFQKERFDIVLTDHEMPFVKGNELAARIKKLAPHQPILMLTAYAHRPSFDNPVDAVLNKPFDSTRLREIMAELLSQTCRNGKNVQKTETDEVGADFETDIVSAQ